MEITTRLLLLSRQSLPRAGLLFDIPNRYPFVDRVGKHDGQPQLLQYIQGPVDLLSASIVGTETVDSKQGTATVTISAGKLSVGSGTLWSFVLSNGSQYEFGTILTATTGVVFDISGNGRHFLFTVADTSVVCLSGREKGSNYLDEYGYELSDGLTKYLSLVSFGLIPEHDENGDDVVIPNLSSGSGCCAYVVGG